MPEPENRRQHAHGGRRRDRGLVLIAVFKLVKAILLLAVGLGTIKLLQPGIAGTARHWLAMVSSGVDQRVTQRAISAIRGMTTRRLTTIGIAAFLYAALYSVEGVGLWLTQRWAEYLTAIATGSFIPFEIYEIARAFSAARILALTLNVAMVAYLVYRLKRPVHA